MIIKSAHIEALAAWANQYPEELLPEIAFAGRSNVGKSSTINCLTNRKNLARTSGQPGKTQTLNFYNINEEFRIVDLPGYGFARVSKQSRKVWQRMIETYFKKRVCLEEIVLIVDIRHKPSVEDQAMYRMILEMGFSGYVVANKADKISRSKQFQNLKVIRETLQMESDKNLLIPFSSASKQGRDQLLDVIQEKVDEVYVEVEEDEEQETSQE
jgi:GTP-binding protein